MFIHREQHRGNRRSAKIRSFAPVALFLLIATPCSGFADERYVEVGAKDVDSCVAVPCGSIGYAVSVSQSGDIIYVGAGDYMESSIDVVHTLKIVGENALTTTIDANGLERIFSVAAGSFLSIYNLTLANGNAGNAGGGAILSEGGGVTVQNSRLLGNVAFVGGAVFAPEGGSLTFTGTELSRNVAHDDAGGAIACLLCSSVKVKNSILTENKAATLGGAIYVESWVPPMLPAVPQPASTKLTVELSTLADNSTGESGGAVATINTEVLIRKSTINNNTTDFDRGGGILSVNQWAAGTLTVDRSTLSFNTAQTSGGAVAVEGFAPVNFVNATVSQNQAQCGGGLELAPGVFGAADVTITNTTFFENVGLQPGCPQHLDNVFAVLTIHNSIITGGMAGAVACGAGAIAGTTNRIDDASCSNGAAFFNLGGVTWLDPVLRFNGGLTQTHKPIYLSLPGTGLFPPFEIGSNAIDAGNNFNCVHPVTMLQLIVDQRGSTRPVNHPWALGPNLCDIGSVEVQP